MEYRCIPGTDEKISVIGLGSYHSWEQQEEVEEVIEKALAAGINYFDTVMMSEKDFICYRNALRNVDRNRYKLQFHFGAVYEKNEYGWTRDVNSIRNEFERQMNLFGCSYADVGLVHCIDGEDDYLRVMSNGLWDYMKSLYKDGVIRYLGCSTHNPMILRKFINLEEITIAMFSINMAYDYINLGTYAIGTLEDRYKLYKECELAGVGLIAMKPYAGKRLLKKELNSFNDSFTTTQCIQYALDRPAVLSVVPGIAGIKQMEATLRYNEASPIEKDYSKLYALSKDFGTIEGACVYCNHCMPCPKGINIGLVNKYYDLAVLGDKLAFDHYKKLYPNAGDCVMCGKCENACPFNVRQTENMERINKFFSK